jgi:uncharacterized membrane protein YkoI
MKVNRKVLAIGAAVAVVAAGGVGIAYAVGGDSEESVTGPDAERAKAAALESVGGGTVTEIEHQDGDGAGLFEVEVQRPGSQVEVYVDGNYNAVGSAGDDDSGAEDEGAADDD